MTAQQNIEQLNACIEFNEKLLGQKQSQAKREFLIETISAQRIAIERIEKQ